MLIYAGPSLFARPSLECTDVAYGGTITIAILRSPDAPLIPARWRTSAISYPIDRGAAAHQRMGAGGTTVIGKLGVEDGAERLFGHDVGWAGAETSHTGITVMPEKIKVRRGDGGIIAVENLPPTGSGIARDQRAF